MATINRAVFDAGPIIHLSEIKKLDFLSLFKEVNTTQEILNECSSIINEVRKLKNLLIKELEANSKDFVKYLIEKYGLQLGEATGITLCKQEKIKFFFTDDLEARGVAYSLGFEPHGTLAIILRAYREKIANKNETKRLVSELYSESSLFITRDLFMWTINEIEKFKR